MSWWEGGQFVSHVLQWKTNAPDFSASSNPSWVNVTVWLWSFGQTISKSIRLLTESPACEIFDLSRCLMRYEAAKQKSCRSENRASHAFYLKPRISTAFPCWRSTRPSSGLIVDEIGRDLSHDPSPGA
jgi:hypothetical protein